jgi:shikimate kinase
MYPDSSCHYRFRSFASQELIFLQFYNMKTNDPSPPPRSNLYLVGLMGTGKTTLGKMLAKNLGMNFLDSDQEIEKAVKKNVSQIFHQKGEAHFRSLEKDFISHGHPQENCLVACGGGLCIPQGMMESLKERGKVVCLWASVTTLVERTSSDKTRPLLQNTNPLSALQELLNQREERYKEADILIETDNLSPVQVVELIISKL